MKYRLIVTTRAQRDADAAYEWMAENISPAYAQRWYRNIFKQFNGLLDYPFRCPLAYENHKFYEDVRVLHFGT